MAQPGGPNNHALPKSTDWCPLNMPIADRIRLSLMMFLNYVIWGSWYVTLGAYLTITLKFTGTEAGAVFGTTALACMISPFFVGLIADRFFASERVLAALHLLGAVLLFFVTKATSFFAVSSILACIPLTFYFSFTNAYLNSLHVPNAAGKMALGQASEVVMMILMPFILRRVSVRSILIMGLLAWSVRY